VRNILPVQWDRASSRADKRANFIFHPFCSWILPGTFKCSSPLFCSWNETRLHCFQDITVLSQNSLCFYMLWCWSHCERLRRTVYTFVHSNVPPDLGLHRLSYGLYTPLTYPKDCPRIIQGKLAKAQGFRTTCKDNKFSEIVHNLHGVLSCLAQVLHKICYLTYFYSAAFCLPSHHQSTPCDFSGV